MGISIYSTAVSPDRGVGSLALIRAEAQSGAPTSPTRIRSAVANRGGTYPCRGPRLKVVFLSFRTHAGCRRIIYVFSTALPTTLVTMEYRGGPHWPVTHLCGGTFSRGCPGWGMHGQPCRHGCLARRVPHAHQATRDECPAHGSGQRGHTRSTGHGPTHELTRDVEVFSIACTVHAGRSRDKVNTSRDRTPLLCTGRQRRTTCAV